MRRRTLLKHFGLGLAGCGMGGGAFITNSDKKPGKKPMKKNSILQHPLCPPRLSIDELGWNEFLRKWDREAFRYLKEESLRFGVDLTGHPTSTGDKDKTLSYIRDLEEEIGSSLPPEIFFGGVSYPPQNQEEEKIAEDKFRNMQKGLKALITSDPRLHGDSRRRGIAYGTHLNSPASEQNIVDTEARFGVELPDSYKNFLRVSNGCSLGLYWTLVPVDQISRYFVDGDMRDYIEEGPDEVSDEIYYGYDELGLVHEPFPYYRPENF